MTSALNNITRNGGQFIQQIQQDLGKAQTLAARAGLHFEDPLIAVYHYRKHGAEFPDAIQRFGDGIEVYLGPVRNEVFNQSNLRQVHTLSVRDIDIISLQKISMFICLCLCPLIFVGWHSQKDLRQFERSFWSSYLNARRTEN